MKISSIILYILSLIFLAIYVLIELTPNLMLSVFGRLFLLCGSCLFLYFGGVLLSKHRKDNKPMKINLWIYFILYLVLLFTFTLLDPMFGRTGLVIFGGNKEIFMNYFSRSINFVPFKTILDYIVAIYNSTLDLKTIFINLFGNIICLMPLAFFIPLLFKKVNNSIKFLLITILASLSIEILQLIFCVGTCDVDDIILNSFGAFICYKILNIKVINDLIKNIFFLEKNKIDFKKILKLFIPIIIVLIVLTLIIVKIHNDREEELFAKHNYDITIVDESKECDQSLEKFYEDKYYEYYFECIKSDKVYAIINGKEKYLVRELLNNNPTDYIVNIRVFENAGLEFIKKEKYTKISVSMDGNYSIFHKIEDTGLIGVPYGNTIYEDNKKVFELFIKPHKSGETTLTLEFDNLEKEEETIIRKYIIKIDKKLNVKYEEVDKRNDDVALTIKPGTQTAKGATIIIKNNTEEIITYGESYYLEKEKNNKWYKLNTINPLKFNAIAYKLKDKESIEMKVNWSYSYGDLGSGKYRLVKDIFIDSDKTTNELENGRIFVEFSID